MVKNLEIVTKEIDSLGRVYIPAKWRKNWKKVLLIRLDDGSILIKPLNKEMKLTDLFDKIEVDIKPEEFEDVHRLRRKLYEEIPGF